MGSLFLALCVYIRGLWEANSGIKSLRPVILANSPSHLVLLQPGLGQGARQSSCELPGRCAEGATMEFCGPTSSQLKSIFWGLYSQVCFSFSLPELGPGLACP